MNFIKTFDFLTALANNNTREWFDAHRKEYLSIRQDVIELCADLLNGISRFDAFAKELDPAACLFRINRDTRFSANKDPYKTNIGAYFNKGGKKANTAGYYLHIQPGASFLAAGIYMPQPTELAKIRQEIDYHIQEFDAIVREKRFSQTFAFLSGEKLTRPPKGYEATNEAIAYLKFKSFIVVKNLKNNDLNPSSALNTCLETFAVAHPFVKFLNEALG